MSNPTVRYAFLFLAAFLVAGMIFCAGCTSAPQKNPKSDGFDDVVAAKMAEYKVPGAVVGIVENDRAEVHPPRVAGKQSAHCIQDCIGIEAEFRRQRDRAHNWETVLVGPAQVGDHHFPDPAMKAEQAQGCPRRTTYDF